MEASLSSGSSLGLLLTVWVVLVDAVVSGKVAPWMLSGSGGLGGLPWLLAASAGPNVGWDGLRLPRFDGRGCYAAMLR